MSAPSGTWNVNSLVNEVVDSIFFSGLFMFVSTSINAIKYICRTSRKYVVEVYKMTNRGRSSGAVEVCDLKEQLALEQAASNPTLGKELPISIGDPRWTAEEGWKKMQQVFVFYNGEKVTIHYVINEQWLLMDDFKIVRIKMMRLK